MRFSTILGGLAAFAATAVAVPASAVVISGTTVNGNVVDPSELSSSQISLDFDIAAFTPITVNFAVETGDAATYNFDSVIEIFTGVNASASGVATMVLGLTNGATFNLGNVAPSFSVATTSLNAARNAVTISFAPAETTSVVLGSLDTVLGDFGINRNGLGARQSFALTLTPASPVPEPATWLMIVAGIGMAGYGLRRSRFNFSHSVKMA